MHRFQPNDLVMLPFTGPGEIRTVYRITEVRSTSYLADIVFRINTDIITSPGRWTQIPFTSAENYVLYADYRLQFPEYFI